MTLIGRRTLPTMIEIDDEGRTTIPSVVAFVPTSDNDGERPHSTSLPPWAPSADSATPNDLQWPVSASNDLCSVHVGNPAIEREGRHPNSTFRNVKRVIGTGGRMAELASGLVPNLFVRSVHGNRSDGNIGGGLNELDAAFDMLENSNGGNEKGKKKKKKKKKKHVSKWKRKKAGELPKLQRQLEQARDDPALLACNIDLPGDDGPAMAPREVLLRPEQVSACVLRELYDAAEGHHRRRTGEEGSRVTRAVIGVPAYFTEAQRRATIRASELAGVSKVKLLAEPEAAALAYGSASDNSNGYSDEEELILVFDLGGGTFDVSILEVGGGVTEVLATVGNNRLGGTDLDRRVAEYLSLQAVEYGRKRNAELKKKSKSNSLDILDGDGDGDFEQRGRIAVRDWYREGDGEVPDIILRTAEEARKSLSNRRAVEVLVPLTEEGWRRVVELDVVVGPFDGARLEARHGLKEGRDYAVIDLDRRTFESLCQAELQMLLQPIREVAIMAGVLLPGEARPSFVENAMAAMGGEEDGENFWEFENETDEEDKPLLIKTGKDTTKIDSSEEKDEGDILSEQALLQIQAMDIKAQKKAQQRGRRRARDIDRRERSFRKQKRSALEEATAASLLGTRPSGGKGGGRGGNNAEPPPTSSVGNERVQDGIHGRPLSRVVLVGGATRTPVIGKLLEAVAGVVPQRTVNPDEAVALGCAVQAGMLDGENDGLMGGTQAVLNPMQAAVMRALARKRGMEDTALMGTEGGGEEAEMMMAMGGGISGMVVDQFDDEDDFY